MGLESSKYKKRLIIIAILIVISMFLGITAEKQIKAYADQVDKLVETIQSIPEEEYEQKISDLNTEEKNVQYNKQQALEFMQAVQSQYNDIFKFSEGYIITLFIFTFSGCLIEIMIYFIFTGWIIKKALPNMKKGILIALQILILMLILILATYIPIIFTILLYVLITTGVLGQIPFIIYTIYKFIKLKKLEDKDDIIKENHRGKVK